MSSPDDGSVAISFLIFSVYGTIISPETDPEAFSIPPVAVYGIISHHSVGTIVSTEDSDTIVPESEAIILHESEAMREILSPLAVFVEETLGFESTTVTVSFHGI